MKLKRKGLIGMPNYEEYKKRALQNPEIKSEYDALHPEFEAIKVKIQKETPEGKKE